MSSDGSNVRFTAVSPRLPVRDLARTVEFYTKRLGFGVDLLWPQNAPTFAIVRRGDVFVQFWTAAETDTIGDALIYFDVSDARAIFDAVNGRVEIDWGPEVYTYGRREFAIRDPDQYQVVFSEETDDEPTGEEP
jgi:catechol 2,3-dioxygenase-like lactoylglutathione lyase family enzyme